MSSSYSITQTPSPLRALCEWNPTSQISQFLEELNYVPPADPASHGEEREDQDSGKELEEWRARVHIDGMSFHEVNIHFSGWDLY